MISDLDAVAAGAVTPNRLASSGFAEPGCLTPLSPRPRPSTTAGRRERPDIRVVTVRASRAPSPPTTRARTERIGAMGHRRAWPPQHLVQLRVGERQGLLERSDLDVLERDLALEHREFAAPAPSSTAPARRREPLSHDTTSTFIQSPPHCARRRRDRRAARVVTRDRFELDQNLGFTGTLKPGPEGSTRQSHVDGKSRRRFYVVSGNGAAWDARRPARARRAVARGRGRHVVRARDHERGLRRRRWRVLSGCDRPRRRRRHGRGCGFGQRRHRRVVREQEWLAGRSGST